MTVISLLSFCFLLSSIQISLSNVYVYNDSNKGVENYDDQAAGFGPSFPAEGLKGYIITTYPKNGCQPIVPPPNIPIGGFHWIALIPRTKNDSCDFDLKVENAQKANFSAVIIYNYEDTLITMGPHDRTIRIPSTLITNVDGKSIIDHYLYSNTPNNSSPKYYVKVMPEQTFKLLNYIIPFVVIVGISFLGLICFMLVKCCIDRRRTRRHRLPRSALKQLKIKKFVKTDPWEVCAICLDDYVEGAKLRILPCDHAYHMKCIDPWLLNSRRQCPVCKRYVFPNQDHSDDEENSSHQQPRTPTEQTPLILSTDNNLPTEISRNRQLFERRVLNLSGSGVPNVSFAQNESSESDEDPSLSSRPATISDVTTTGLVFAQPSANSRRYRQQPLPRRSSRQTNPDENNTTVSTYGSVSDSPTTMRAANFFVGSLGGTTDTTNISTHSVLEDVSDIETIDDDDDERMHSVLTGSEGNPAYVHDEESTTNIVRTIL